MQIVLYLQPSELMSFLEGNKVEAFNNRHLPAMYEIRIEPDEVILESAQGMFHKGNFMIQKRES